MQQRAGDFAKILGGKPEGAGYLCRCPMRSHGKGRGDLRPSLGVSDGDRGLIVHCFAGCDPRDVLAALRKLAPDAVRLRAPATSPAGVPPRRAVKTTTDLALRLWRAAIDVAGTPAETYLRSRSLPASPPKTIRFLRSYRYDETRRFPCLVAAVQAPSREIVAVQLTFLHPSGRRKAEVDHPRRAIGPLGDALLRLAPAAEHLGLAVGFETAWAASLLENGFPVWATLGADRFGVVTLPPTVRRVTIYADYDAPSLSNALAFFARHPELDVWIAPPPIIGADFAQILELQSAASKSAALLK